jgi:hypothetical protein
MTDSARKEDENGYILVRDNPIICAGVFPYSGRQLPDADPNQTYNVYRPIEELTKAETLESFIGLPIVDEHEMLGAGYNRNPEDRGVHGAILEAIKVVGNDVLAPLRIFSKTLKSLIDSGKEALSLGYRCRFEKNSGVFNGIAYNYIQRDIRGNHLALVMQGRNGTAVLDSCDVFDHFDLALDKQEDYMADEQTEEKTVEKAAMTLAEVHAFLSENAPMWKELQSLMGGAVESEEVALDADTKEKDGEQKADDACDKETEKKEEAMDTAAINSLLDARLGAERKNIVKSVMADVHARDALVKKLTPHIGTFACDTMDVNEVAVYGAKKLGITAPAGAEAVAIDAYLAGLEKTASKVTYAMDSKPKTDGLLAKRLSGKA